MNNVPQDMVKRVIPFAAVGGLVCSYCIIEKSKNLVGLELPDILTLPNHDEMLSMMEVEQADDLAFSCLEAIVKKNGIKENEATFCRASNLQNNNSPGSIFIGLLIKHIALDETMSEFRTRVKDLYEKLGMSEADIETIERNQENVKELTFVEDLFFFYTNREDETDTDDFDSGIDAGYEEGALLERILARIAIYRILKNKKARDIDLFLEDFNSILENLKSDNKFLQKWTKKYEEEIED